MTHREAKHIPFLACLQGKVLLLLFSELCACGVKGKKLNHPCQGLLPNVILATCDLLFEGAKLSKWYLMFLDTTH